MTKGGQVLTEFKPALGNVPTFVISIKLITVSIFDLAAVTRVCEGQLDNSTLSGPPDSQWKKRESLGFAPVTSHCIPRS